MAVIKRLDFVEAIYAPQETSSEARRSARKYAGQKGRFQATLTVLDGRYKGQFAFAPRSFNVCDFGWIPQEDLDIVSVVDG